MFSAYFESCNLRPPCARRCWWFQFEAQMKQVLKLSGRLDGDGGMNESLMGNASAGDSECCSQCVVQ